MLGVKLVDIPLLGAKLVDIEIVILYIEIPLSGAEFKPEVSSPAHDWTDTESHCYRLRNS